MGDIDIYPYPESNNGVTDIAQQANAPVTPDIGELWMDTDENAGVGLSSILAYAEKTNGNFTLTGATVTDIPELTVTITVPAGRRIKITAQGGLYNNQATSNQAIWLLIREGANQLQASNSGTHSPSGTYGDTAIVNTVWIGSPSAGTHTYKVSAVANNTNGIFTTSASSPAFILVEDITGSLWPAGQSIGMGAIANEPWIDYTPTLTNITLGNGTLSGRYTRIGRTIHGAVRLLWGSTTSASGDFRFGLPVLARSLTIFGSGFIGYDTGSQRWPVTVSESSSGEIRLYHPVSTLNVGVVNPSSPFTWGSGDEAYFGFTYEAGS